MPSVWRFAEDNDNYGQVGGSTMELDRSLTQSGQTRMAGGFMRFAARGTHGPHTVGYDEFLVVIRGQLELITDEGTVTVGEGEIGVMAEGTTLTYRAEAGTLVAYAVTPRPA